MFDNPWLLGVQKAVQKAVLSRWVDFVKLVSCRVIQVGYLVENPNVGLFRPSLLVCFPSNVLEKLQSPLPGGVALEFGLAAPGGKRSGVGAVCVQGSVGMSAHVTPHFHQITKASRCLPGQMALYFTLFRKYISLMFALVGKGQSLHGMG